jgi:hypothetical protein
MAAANDPAPAHSDVLSQLSLLSMGFCNYIRFLWIGGFVLQKLRWPPPCFQYVLGFVFFVAFARFTDLKSPCNSRFHRG